MTTATLDGLTQRVLHWHDSLPWTTEFGVLLPPVLAELVKGEPVDPARVAERAGIPATEMLDFLRRSPSEWDDDGRLVGFGLTLRPTVTGSRSAGGRSTRGARPTRSRSR